MEQRRILDRALSAADHDDVPSLETTEVPVLGGMRDQLWRQLRELFWPVGIVVDSDRHHDRVALYLAPILERNEKPAVLTLDR